MRIKSQQAADMFRRRSRPIFRCALPFVGASTINVEDGRALIFPARGRGCLVVDWFRFCAWLRKRGIR
jgi:hypothetical protein